MAQYIIRESELLVAVELVPKLSAAIGDRDDTTGGKTKGLYTNFELNAVVQPAHFWWSKRQNGRVSLTATNSGSGGMNSWGV